MELAAITELLIETEREKTLLEQNVKRLYKEVEDGARTIRQIRVAMEADYRHTERALAIMLGTVLRRHVGFDFESWTEESAGAAVERLTRSGFFDQDWYTRENPDVSAAGMEPARHYLIHGASEGRLPCQLRDRKNDGPWPT